MAHQVKPMVYCIGLPQLRTTGRNNLVDFVRDIGVPDFMDIVEEARTNGLSDGEILCSIYAKLCYLSFSTDLNKNLSRVRNIEQNLKNCFDIAHTSVFGHCCLNFIAHNVSRVYTHEQIRHEVGTDYTLPETIPAIEGLHEWSQQSGRYCALDDIPVVLDPVLEEDADEIMQYITAGEQLIKKLQKKHRLDDPSLSFDRKKQVTSSLRRLAPCGQGNDLGMTINLRALRHVLQMRTSPGAEWEIRYIYTQVGKLIMEHWPGMLTGVQIEEYPEHSGLFVYKGMRTQPYHS